MEAEESIGPELEEETPETRKAAALDILRKLRDIMVRAEAGEPVYAEMAARIDARERERAEALIREALEG